MGCALEVRAVSWAEAGGQHGGRPGGRKQRAPGLEGEPELPIEKLPVAFLAGLASVITPCVLPLVPGYLSAVSAIDVDRLGERLGRMARGDKPGAAPVTVAT